LAARFSLLVNLLLMAMIPSIKPEMETWDGGLSFTHALWLDQGLKFWCG
jgi:hypothetical protein